MASALPVVTPVTPFGYEQRADTGGGLGQYGYGSLSVCNFLQNLDHSFASSLLVCVFRFPLTFILFFSHES